jgi:hypothetical protein
MRLLHRLSGDDAGRAVAILGKGGAGDFRTQCRAVERIDPRRRDAGNGLFDLAAEAEPDDAGVESGLSPNATIGGPQIEIRARLRLRQGKRGQRRHGRYVLPSLHPKAKKAGDRRGIRLVAIERQPLPQVRRANARVGPEISVREDAAKQHAVREPSGRVHRGGDLASSLKVENLPHESGIARVERLGQSDTVAAARRHARHRIGHLVLVLVVHRGLPLRPSMEARRGRSSKDCSARDDGAGIEKAGERSDDPSHGDERYNKKLQHRNPLGSKSGQSGAIRFNAHREYTFYHGTNNGNC